MAASKYILFPRDAQPTDSEVRALESCAHATGSPRFGINKRSGGLAIEFDAVAFKSTRLYNFEFDALVSAWEQQGCTVSDACAFAFNPNALQARLDAPSRSFPTPDQLPPLDLNDLRAREAVGMSRLETAQLAANIKEGGELIKTVVPYLVLCVAFGTILYVGYAAYNAAQNIDIETRRETIQRVGKQPLTDQLTPLQPSDEKRNNQPTPPPSDESKNSPSPR